MEDNLNALQSSAASPSSLESRISGKQINLLLMDGAELYRDLLTAYLIRQGAAHPKIGFVFTHEYALRQGDFGSSMRRLNWPVEDAETGYFAGAFSNNRDTDTVVGLQFSGDRPTCEGTLLIAARLYNRGTYFRALLHVLERHFDRKFEDASSLSNLAFFGEVREPPFDDDLFVRRPGKVTGKNVLLCLGEDKNHHPPKWYGYVPIVDGSIVGTPAVYVPVDSQQ